MVRLKNKDKYRVNCINASNLFKNTQISPKQVLGTLGQFFTKCKGCGKMGEIKNMIPLECTCVFCPKCLREDIHKQTRGNLIIAEWEGVKSDGKHGKPSHGGIRCLKHKVLIPLAMIYILFPGERFEKSSVDLFRRYKHQFSKLLS